MKGYLKRDDDFASRRAHLADMSDEQLKERFWALAEQIMDPLYDLAKENTTPAVERAVLLRMGISSLEAQPLVDGAMDRGLMGKGVGHIVYRIARENNLEIREAGQALIEGKYWDQAVEIFKGGQK